MAKSFQEFRKIYDQEFNKFNQIPDEKVAGDEYNEYLELCSLVGVVDSEIYAEKDESGNVEIFMKPIYGQPYAP